MLLPLPAPWDTSQLWGDLCLNLRDASCQQATICAVSGKQGQVYVKYLWKIKTEWSSVTEKTERTLTALAMVFLSITLMIPCINPQLLCVHMVILLKLAKNMLLLMGSKNEKDCLIKNQILHSWESWQTYKFQNIYQNWPPPMGTIWYHWSHKNQKTQIC